MKRFLLLLSLFAVLGASLRAQVTLNATNFPDAYFRTYLADKFSIAEGAVITAEQIAATDVINVSALGVKDMTGIAYFTELTELQCARNAITTLDVSHNTRLELLSCWGNKLTTLDVTMLPNLYYLDFEENNIATIDLTHNPELVFLFLSNNPLTTLNLYNNRELAGINGYSCKFTNLDFSANTALEEAYLEDNCLSEGAMDALVQTLPNFAGSTTKGVISVFAEGIDGVEGKNVCNTNTVAKATAKQWQTKYYLPNDEAYADYTGSEPTGIRELKQQVDHGAHRYNLSGQRVGSNYRGIVLTKQGKTIQ